MLISRLILFVGLAICFVSYIWVLVIAFKKDILWGIGCLFISVLTLVFLILNWDTCKKAFLTFMVGLFIFLVGMLLFPAF